MTAQYRAENGGTVNDIALYGQDATPTARRFALMNFAIHRIEADIGSECADPFRRDLHKDLKADFIVAGPQFNDSDWHRVDDDVRWQYGTPPKGNANFAWVQHFIHHLAPDGFAGFVLANGSMSSNQSGEGDIRKALIEADLVDCMVALPGQLFYSTQIPVCLWFLTKSKAARTLPRHDPDDLPDKMRARHRETLFIDARKMGALIDRVHRELTESDIERIVRTYHSWRLDIPMGEVQDGDTIALVDPNPDWIYADVPGFCKSATTEDIAAHRYVLTPGRYVGAEEVEDDGEPFEEKMARLVADLNVQFAESARLEAEIKKNLLHIGYEIP